MTQTIKQRASKMEWGMRSDIHKALHTLAGGANLSAKWSKDCSQYATEEYRLTVLNQYFTDTINMLSALVDGYIPGNLDIKKSE